ncbi:MAG: helix-turn-helix domain-containing protein [Solirubrobacterales bacterium]
MSPVTLEITEDVSRKLRAELPAVASAAAGAVLAEVPGYSDLDGLEGATLDQAVELALLGFLSSASGSSSTDPASPLQPALDAAYSLGRGEARSGRTMDVLLSAYRVGARAAWREWSMVAVKAGVAADWLSRFAELNFAYIDELSAASASGYSDQLETLDRTQQRKLEHFTRRLLSGGPPELLQAEADQAGWQPPDNLCAVILPSSRARGIRTLVDPRSLQLTDDLPGTAAGQDLNVLLVPAIGTPGRERLKALLEGKHAIVGPERPWVEAGLSYSRALQVKYLRPPGTEKAADADDFLVQLVVGADPEALGDLRKRVLAPLAQLRPSTTAKLTDTLRAWLLHQGRRKEIAAALFIHPQTVRYRMGQLRDLYGDQLDDPEMVLAATVALSTSLTDETSVV